MVTGAGRGLGAAHARALAAAGAAVVVNDLSVSVDGAEGDGQDVAAGVVAEIVAAGGRAVADRSDVGSFAGGAAVVRTAVESFGRVDIVVNNAGILLAGKVAELSEVDFARCLNVHVLGGLSTARAAFPYMRERNFGRVVNTISEAALGTGYHAGVAYATAKSAIWGLTMALADEGAPFGITVNAVSPGALTRMSRDHVGRTALDLAPEHVSRVVLELVAGAVTGRVVHAAAGAVREYRLRRTADTELVRRLVEEEQQ